jgi:proteasome lid subunit RPN8/RPN11
VGKVILRNSAFVNMLASTLEVYKKESYGILMGRRQGNDYVVRQAFSYQSATRHYDWVTVEPRRRNRVDALLQTIMHYRFLGDYHSHIDWPDHLSEADKKEMREQSIPLSMLILVKDTNRRRKWRFLESDRSLTGTVADRYFVKLYAFEYDPDRNRIQKLRVKCSYIHRLNRESPFEQFGMAGMWNGRSRASRRGKRRAQRRRARRKA